MSLFFKQVTSLKDMISTAKKIYRESTVVRGRPRTMITRIHIVSRLPTCGHQDPLIYAGARVEENAYIVSYVLMKSAGGNS